MIDEKIVELENKIQELDSIADDRIMSDEVIEARKLAQIGLWEWMKKKESYWAQMSRTQWIKEGDRNTGYFHRTTTIRKRPNTMDQLMTDGVRFQDSDKTKEEAVKFF